MTEIDIEDVFVRDVNVRSESNIYSRNNIVIEVSRYDSINMLCITEWKPILFEGAVRYNENVIEKWEVINETWVSSSEHIESVVD